MYWLTYSSRDGISVLILPGSSLIFARMRAALLGIDPGEFQEGHQLDGKAIKRIPANMVGRRLSAA